MMYSLKKLFFSLLSLAAVSVVSCVNEQVSSEEDYGSREVASLQEQMSSVQVSLGHIQALESAFENYVAEVTDKEEISQSESRMSAVLSAAETMEAHASFLATGVSRLEGTIATLAQQKVLAQSLGAFEGTLSSVDMAAYDKYLKSHVVTICEGAQNWIGKPFTAYFTVLFDDAMMTSLSNSLSQVLSAQKASVEGLMSDVESGLRGDEEAEQLQALSADISDNTAKTEGLTSLVTEIVIEFGSECEEAVRAVLTTGKYDSSSLRTLSKSASAAVKATATTLNDLIARVAACEAQIEDILDRLGALEAEIDVIQSITFVPEYAASEAVAYYTMETSRISDPASPYNGYCNRTPADDIELNFLVRPAAAAAALKTAFDKSTDVLSVFGYYAQGIQLASVSSANTINFEITDVKVVNQAQGLIKVCVKHDLKEEFYFRGTGAKCVLSVVSGKTDITSKFVDLVPKDKSGTVYVESIRLSEQKLTFDDGDTYRLSATVSPSGATNTNVIWKSDNHEVVTVENGLLTAVGAGTAVITATADGTDEWGFNLSTTCQVTVQEAIKLAGPAYVEMGKTAEIQLDYPSDLIVNKKTWWIETSSPGPTASVENGVVTPSSYYYDSDTKEYGTLVVKCQVNETVLSHELMVVAEQPSAVKIGSLADNVNNATVKLGGTISLSATIYPQSVHESGLFRLYYMQDVANMDVATMDYQTGYVSTKAPGTAYMKVDVYTKEGFNYFAPGHDVVRRTVRIDVEPYWVKTITFAQNSYELTPESTMTVEAIFTSDVDNVQPSYKDLVWTSSNPDVATINETTGTVTAVASGTTVIRATASSEWAVKEGDPEVYGEYTLTVKEPAKAIKVGDYYYSDGDWSTDLDLDADDNGRTDRNVVGIVFAVGNYAASDSHLLADKSTCSNGLVLGLNEGTSAYNGSSGWSKNDVGKWLTDNGYTNITSADKVVGYGNTKGFKTLNNAKVVSYDNIIDIALPDVAESYSPSAPDQSSGWYIPSYQEMKLIYNNLATINAKLSAIGGTVINAGQNVKYFTSTLKESWGYYYFYGFMFSTGDWYGYQANADDVYYVRVALAF